MAVRWAGRAGVVAAARWEKTGGRASVGWKAQQSHTAASTPSQDFTPSLESQPVCIWIPGSRRAQVPP